MMYIRLCLPKIDHGLAKIFYKTAKTIYGDKIIVDNDNTAMRYHKIEDTHCYDILLGEHSTPKDSHNLSKKLDSVFPDELNFEIEVTQDS